MQYNICVLKADVMQISMHGTNSKIANKKQRIDLQIKVLYVQ